MFYHMSKVTRPETKTKTVRLLDLEYGQVVFLQGEGFTRLKYAYKEGEEPVYRFRSTERDLNIDLRIIHGNVYVVKYTPYTLPEHSKHDPADFGLHKERNFYRIKIIEEKRQGVVKMAPFKKGDSIRGDYIVDAISDAYLVAVDNKGNSVFVDKKGGSLGVTFIQDNDPDYVFIVNTED